MKLRKILSFFLLATAAWAGSTPLRMESGYPFVEVTVNGAGPFRMLVDTGAESCMLTPRAAKAAGLRFDAKVRMETVTGAALVPVSSANEVRVGGDSRTGVEFAVSALAGIRQVDERVDGVIGQSFLRQAPYLIDYRAKKLWLDDEAAERGQRLPLALTSAENPRQTIVPVAIGKEKAVRQLMLDSGSSDLILECSERCPKLGRVEEFDVRTNQGSGRMQRGVLAAVEVGGAVLHMRPAALREQASGERDGLLPAAWFAAVYVDSPNHVVRFGEAR